MMKKHLTCGMHVIGLTTNACAGIKCLIMSLVIKQLKHNNKLVQHKAEKLVIFTHKITTRFCLVLLWQNQNSY